MCGKFKNLEVVEEVYYFIFSDCLVELIVGGCKLRKQNLVCMSKEIILEFINKLNYLEFSIVFLLVMSLG